MHWQVKVRISFLIKVIVGAVQHSAKRRGFLLRTTADCRVSDDDGIIKVVLGAK